uniref:Link domain-containing protein n=1 Tax=Periophthalmus magnuspinnatus TaxID=409849 RepID=A0A3B4AU98_9GOBI
LSGTNAKCTDLHFEGMVHIDHFSSICVHNVCTCLHNINVVLDTMLGVFHLRSAKGQYKLNYTQAQQACGAEGARLATYNQLSYAQQGGLNMCAAGWLDQARVAYPTTYSSPNCGFGHVGIVDYGVRKDLGETWDTFCYRIKGKMRIYSAILQFSLNSCLHKVLENCVFSNPGKKGPMLCRRQKYLSFAIFCYLLQTSEGRSVTLTSCNLFTRGPSEEQGTSSQKGECKAIVTYIHTLSSGAPACGSAFSEQGQRGHPDVDGSHKVIEDEWLFQLQQGNVILFSLSAVILMNEDYTHCNHLHLKFERRVMHIPSQQLTLAQSGFSKINYIILSLTSKYNFSNPKQFN